MLITLLVLSLFFHDLNPNNLRIHKGIDDIYVISKKTTISTSKNSIIPFVIGGLELTH